MLNHKGRIMDYLQWFLLLLMITAIILSGGKRHGYKYQPAMGISISDDSQHSDRDSDSYYEERETWEDSDS